ncbi:Na+/H+ antiporter NhaC family protein [Sutterella sp.]|uniref:Na+/H+ antiporter NhaC family protein n=1 Tax=Sutterella sp. TaxID=1981025 RepID=UPI0026DF4DE7|nr:Na+/H+ antiporter NhaC family protein [Sutterella sp.]MDO5532974.1 Na+/H+ antiporter NhaC family protein [Sutterella sp.]
MSPTLVIGLFCLGLLACLVLGLPVLLALAFGLALFVGYGFAKGVPFEKMRVPAIQGLKTTSGIIIALLLIGMLTASWRASGTIATLVSLFTDLITPGSALVLAFVLNALLSVLTGTSYGTAATMGVISMTMTDAMGISPILAGGAILSGVYVGDRCSPVSTSASLVAAITGTSLYKNVRLMALTGAPPFLLACAIYAAAGFLFPAKGETLDVTALFAREFDLSLATLIPAAVLFGLVFFRISIRCCMAASIFAAVGVAMWVQGTPAADLARFLLTGFTAREADIAHMMNGGGLVSMFNVCGILLIASTYSGIFEATGLLSGIRGHMPALAKKLTPFGAITASSVVTSVVGCNQVIPTMLTRELCRDVEPDRQRMALALEDTAIVIAPLIPWSIACAVPLTSIGAPVTCIPAACFLWLLPVCAMALPGLRNRILD